MERGPVALFGAIVAVGLGPAMWLGAQFGNAIDLPAGPPAVTSERGPHQATLDKGGEAGSAPDNSVIVETTPRSEIQPLPAASKRPQPHRTTASATAVPSPSSASPKPSGGTDGGQATPPPAGNSSPPPGGGPGGNLPPSPPAGGSGSSSGPGGGNGSGGTGDGGPIAS